MAELGPAFIRIQPGKFRFAPKARNFIFNEISHPCARPWYLYVQTFIPAFLKLFITLILLQLDDVIRDYAIVRAGDAPDGARRRGSHFRKLRGSNQATKSQKIFRQGLITVLKVTAPLEAIGFVWLMYTAGDRFFYDWQGLLNMSDFCSRPAFTGPLSRTDPPSQIGSQPFGQGFGYATLVQNRASWSTQPTRALVPEGNIDMMATLTVQRDFSPLDGVALGFRVNVGGKTHEFIGESMTIPDDHPVDLIVRGEVRANVGQTAIIVWLLFGPATGTGMQCHDGDVHITNDIK